MGDTAQEQSMEEILSTIKRVIAKDQAARGGNTMPRARAPRKDVDETPSADDVLELTAEMAPELETIVSTSVAEASRNALSALAAKRARAAAAPAASIPDIGGKTIETLVTDMLRPMLKDWLDANLPEMVERMVAKEIARISEEDR